MSTQGKKWLIIQAFLPLIGYFRKAAQQIILMKNAKRSASQ